MRTAARLDRHRSGSDHDPYVTAAKDEKRSPGETGAAWASVLSLELAGSPQLGTVSGA